MTIACAAASRGRASKLSRALPLLALTLACRDVDTTNVLGAEEAAGPSTASAVASAEPVYAMATIVFNPDDTATSYILLSHTPDLDGVSLSDAREFPGRVDIATTAGYLFVSSGDEPTLRRFSFSDSLAWVDEEVLSFANYGIGEVQLQTLVNERAAYAPVGEYDPTRVVWDPAGFQLVGSGESSRVPAQVDGLTGRWSGYRFRERPGPPRRTVYYDDGDFFELAPFTTVVVYDPVTHAEARTFDVPCPGMYEYSQDEAGNTYMTSVASPALALYGRLQGSCARRIGPDGVLDPDWQPDFTRWTGGRQLSGYEYAGRGKAIATVLHHEELEALGADFDGEYDPDVYDESSNGNHFRPWVLDLRAETAQPVPGVEPGVQTDVFQFEDRTFLNVNYDEWTRGVMYELADDGSAERRFDVPAYVQGWVRVR